MLRFPPSIQKNVEVVLYHGFACNTNQNSVDNKPVRFQIEHVQIWQNTRWMDYQVGRGYETSFKMRKIILGFG